MNTSQIKAYAPKARNDFIKAVTQRAARFGIHGDNNIDPVEFKGDVAIINDQIFTKKGGELREKLVASVKQKGFEIFIRSNAYTWFNRFIAIRYMELHDFFDHGLRVLSNSTDSDIPEILEHAADVDLPGLDKVKIMELRLAGDKDNELYKMLIIAQCNALHKVMPFLFDPVDSEAELLLPDNLLHSNSPVKKLVDEIDEDLWDNVEIIGWIYQFYISEKKDEVIGKIVKSKDIPAATQLFTPNWIVKYMVQNTLGKMWLATYPESYLKDNMEYYIEPAQQEPEVQKEIDAITPEELNPENLTFLDPACGSAHILVEAYDIFKRIYLERGYRTRDIPRLILEKNIYGLDIDDRAAQLAFFSVLMKARQDDRRILNRDNLKLNISSIQASSSDDILQVETFFQGKDQIDIKNTIKELLNLFENGKTFGSLILIPEEIASKINNVKTIIDGKLKNWGSKSSVQKLRKIVDQAWILSKKYDCVVANPPYMGSKGMNQQLKEFAKNRFPVSKSDLFAIFIERNLEFSKKQGLVGMITMQSWMFLSSYEKLREFILKQKTILSMAHFGARAFDSIGGEVVSTTTFVLKNDNHSHLSGSYLRLIDGKSEKEKKNALCEAIKNPDCGWFFNAFASDFKKVPGCPIAYWFSKNAANNCKILPSLAQYSEAKSGMSSCNSALFLRQWFEVSSLNINRKSKSHFDANASKAKWYPYNKGGGNRRWFGYNDVVINWANEGQDIKTFVVNNPKDPHTTHWSRRLFNLNFFFSCGLTWSAVTSKRFSCRSVPLGIIPGTGSKTLYALKDYQKKVVFSLLNTNVSSFYLSVFSPTLNFEAGDVVKIPIIQKISSDKLKTDNLVDISKMDWDSYETSLDFTTLLIFQTDCQQPTLKDIYTNTRSFWQGIILKMQGLEQENNRIFIEAYGLQEELTPEVPIEEITLTCNPAYRYGKGKTKEEYEVLQRTDTMKELISYAIGCMMGRYSLDKEGLIYAHSGNDGFKPSQYKTFPADDDGIIPIMDMEWFEDDAATRFIEFIKTAWPPETLDENLKFIADNLKPKANESPEDTIRRYLSAAFFKDHMKTYKKRPIYWLFSSGKLKAFECLVYLHRYNDSTLSRMRSNYVIPLQGNISARIEFLDHEKDAATTASTQRTIQKQIDVLKKKQVELKTFDDELRHYADMKIPLDLDDGVKVNYGKFGNLLAQKKAITGKK
jgi:type II restriction/modification system DNA methylase subunit YeeA